MRKSIFILFFSLVGVLSAQAYDFMDDRIRYNFISDTSVEVTTGGYGGYSGSVVIPSTVMYGGDTYRVTSIGSSAFYDCSGLTSVTIPESVTTIGTVAFQGCSGLTTVEWNAVACQDNSGPFDNCENITSITFGNQVERIPACLCCWMEKLTSVTIPESVTIIGSSAFEGCSGLTTVEWNAVACQDFEYSYSSYEKPPFYNCKNITSITFGNQVERIPAYLCYGLEKLTSVTIPEGVTAIGECAFYKCSGLTSVTIPKSVTTIGSAFWGCSGLTTVTIPESVTTIGFSAFEGCSGLTTVEWNAVACQDFDYNSCPFPFKEHNYITSITFGNQVERIPACLCYGMEKLTSVTIPESVTIIGSSAFEGCSGLTTVEWNAVACQDFEYSYSSYEKPPFYNCKNITSITFGNQVERIPAYLCYGLEKLTSVTIPESVASIGENAFSMSGLTTVTIPKSVTSIGASAFSGCSGLSSVTLSEGVTSIGEFAFSWCSGLTMVTSLSKTPPYCSGSVFDVYDTLYVPQGSRSAYRSAQEWRKFRVIEDGTHMRTVTVEVNDASMGRVVGGGDYVIGEEATIEAIPNTGYHFVKWDDGEMANPRLLTVTEDITLTAIFAKNGTEPTGNENADVDNFRVYAQDRTIFLSEDRGLVQVYNVAGQCVYNGHATTILVQQGGLYIVNVGGRRYKVLVR